MTNLFTNQSIALRAGQAASGVASRAQTLRVLRGRAWITVEGVAHDYWLSAGDTFIVPPERLVVIEADRVGGDLAAAVEHRQSALALLTARLRRFAQRNAYHRHAKAAARCAARTGHCA